MRAFLFLECWLTLEWVQPYTSAPALMWDEQSGLSSDSDSEDGW